MMTDGREGPSSKGIVKASWIFSPDSKSFAYVATVTDGVMAVILDDEVQTLWPNDARNNSGLNAELIFSPDSRRLAYFVRQGGEGFAAIDGAPEEKYTSPLSRRLQASAVSLSQVPQNSRLGNNFTFSPDSRHYAYAVANGTDHVLIYDGAERRRHKSPDGILNTSVLFSPSSDHFAYGAQRKNNARQYVVIDCLDTKDFAGLAEVEPRFSDDSRNLAYVTTSDDRCSLIVDSLGDGAEIRRSEFPLHSPPQLGAPLSWIGNAAHILTRNGRTVRLARFVA
jgi:Tol biopolymer transport system component